MEKIKRYSRVIHIMLSIAFYVLIAILIMEILAWIFSSTRFPTEIVSINGTDVEAPVLFRIGKTRIIMPIIWRSGFDLSDIPKINVHFSTVGFGDILGAIFALIAIRFAQIVFKRLRVNGSPFREEVVKPTRRLAIFLLLMGGVSGIIPFIAAGIVGVFCLIFDYGRMLQNESDTTL